MPLDMNKFHHIDQNSPETPQCYVPVMFCIVQEMFKHVFTNTICYAKEHQV